MARRVGYGTLVSESMRAARRLKPMWVLGAFVLYIQAGYIVVIEKNFLSFLEGDHLSSAALLGLLLPGLVVIIGMLHAAADGGLIATGAAVATGQTLSLPDAWREGRRKTGLMLISWLVLSAVLVGWAGITSGIPVLLGVIVHPIVGVGFGLLGLVLYLVTFLFLFPLGMFATRALVLHDEKLTEAWRTGLVMVRENPARAAGVTLTGVCYAFALWCVELLVVVVTTGIVAFARDRMPVPLIVAASVLLFLPAYVGVRGWFGSALSYYWTMAFLWTAREAPDEDA